MLLIRHPPSYPQERAYILDVVLGEFLGLEFTAQAEERLDTEIALAQAPDGKRLLVSEGLFATPATLWLSSESLPARPLARWALAPEPLGSGLLEAELPILYGESLPAGSFYEELGRTARLGLDVFGSIFFQLTRYEEIADDTRDAHDRFPHEASLAHREGFLGRPLANEYLELLWAALERLGGSLQRRRHTFTERLSHDVDWPLHKPLSSPRLAKAMLGDVVRRRDAGLAGARLRARNARRRSDTAGDSYNSFDFIMDLSEQEGLRSAFYFQAGRTDARFDGTYSLEEPWIGALIRRIHERGHEIGLHPSYATFRDPLAILSEREVLAGVCERLGVLQPQWGGRQHFLRWENPTTWRGWEQAGLAYDSSLGFSHAAGFRCGVCFEYPVFDLRERRRLRLRERPLVAMEMAVIDGPGTSERAAVESIDALRRRCRHFGGEFTLLWHNSRLASRRERALYTASVRARN
jgi:hypothetical protein